MSKLSHIKYWKNFATILLAIGRARHKELNKPDDLGQKKGELGQWIFPVALVLLGVG
jgi:hypothetical protein